MNATDEQVTEELNTMLGGDAPCDFLVNEFPYPPCPYPAAWVITLGDERWVLRACERCKAHTARHGGSRDRDGTFRELHAVRPI